MTLRACAVAYPPIQTFPTSAPTITSHVMNASGEAGAFIFPVPKTGSITAVRFRLASINTATDLDVGIEGTTGDPLEPDGTYKGGGSPVSVTIASGSLADGSNLATFDNAYSATAGEIIAVTLRPQGTPDYAFSSCNSNWRNYSDTGITLLRTTSWAITNDTEKPVLDVIYSDGSRGFIPNVIPIYTASGDSIASNTTPDEKGNHFIAPFTGEINILFGVVEGDADWDYVLYDSDDTAIATGSYDASLRNQSTPADHWSYVSVAPVMIYAGRKYRIVAKPTSTSTIDVRYLVAAEQAAWQQMCGRSDIGETYRTDAGAWTDDNDNLNFMGVYYSSVLIPQPDVSSLEGALS